MRVNRPLCRNGEDNAPGLPASFARETALLAITGRSRPDASTRRFERRIVLLAIAAYGAASIACVLVFGSGWLDRRAESHFPVWAIAVLACLGLSVLFRACLYRYADHRRGPKKRNSSNR